LWLNNVFCRDKNHTLTYRRLFGFVESFVYLGFLDTMLSLIPSFFPIVKMQIEISRITSEFVRKINVFEDAKENRCNGYKNKIK